ncbi:MAG: L-seryl-tRNA(Sec) selenium transferase [Burkholderiaceae bacterium]|nr:L-seryl-tRNA(Sec) selenium transferase [Burkholderiaceae bacterium]
MNTKVLPGSGESESKTNPLHLPSVDRLLADTALAQQADQIGRALVKRAVQQTLAQARESIARGGAAPTEAQLIGQAQRLAQQQTVSRLPKVINLTGTVIHTNLGRALLSEEAIASVVSAMRGYNALEFDIDSGGRGDRDDVIEDLICRLTGAEAATVVNNCAAAVLLALVALGARKEVIISRGEQIEIGGAFRMPDIMRAANCKLVEVGTTNRTHLRDYQEAISEKASLIVKAHRSNYAVTGFTAEVGDAELAALAKQAGIFYMVDLGSGALVDMSQWGLPREPLPSDALSKGADVVMFSGDKLLGGPQAGIIVGSRAAISRIKKHPLKRALRVSKLVLAALEATLRVYDSDHHIAERLPVLAMLSKQRDVIRAACERVAPMLARHAGDAFEMRIADCASQIGSGALPEERLPSAAVVLTPKSENRRNGALLNKTLASFRKLPTPVIGRISDDAIVFDCRCLSPADEQLLREQLQ